MKTRSGGVKEKRSGGPKIEDCVVACCFVAAVPVLWAIGTLVYVIWKAWGAQIGA